MTVGTATRTSQGTGSGSGSGGGGFKAIAIVVALVVLVGGGVAVYATATGTLPWEKPQPAPSARTNPPVLIDDDPDHQFLAADDGADKVRTCNKTAIVDDKLCCPKVLSGQVWTCDIKVVVIDAARTPFIARNITLAWGMGKPSILHKQEDAGRRKYLSVCGPSVFTAAYAGVGSCDEYPFRSSAEGGVHGNERARTEEVHRTEQNSQGGTISTAYQSQMIYEGDEFVVVIVHPENIPDKAWAGQPYLVTT